MKPQASNPEIAAWSPVPVNLVRIKGMTLYAPLALMLLYLGAFVSCTTAKEAEKSIVTMKPFGSGAILPEDEVAHCIRRARDGDGESAYKLFAHYAIGLGDEKNGRVYFERAVGLGYPPALYSKAVEIWDSDNPDLSEVRNLVQRAMAGGIKDSNGILSAVEVELKKRGK